MRGALLWSAPLPPPSGGVATHVRELERALRRSASTRARSIRAATVPMARDDGRGLVARWRGARARRPGPRAHQRSQPQELAPGRRLLAAGRAVAVDAALGAGARRSSRAHRALAAASSARAIATVVAVNAEIAAALVAAGVDPRGSWCARPSRRASLAFRLPPPGLAALRAPLSAPARGALAPGRRVRRRAAPRRLRAAARAPPRRRPRHLWPGHADPALAAAIARRGLAGAVQLYGELGRERALAVVAAADFFVRPTLADGDALSVREALALGGRWWPPPSAPARAEVADLSLPAIAGRAARKPLPRRRQALHRTRSSDADCLPTLLRPHGAANLRSASP